MSEAGTYTLWVTRYLCGSRADQLVALQRQVKAEELAATMGLHAEDDPDKEYDDLRIEGPAATLVALALELEDGDDLSVDTPRGRTLTVQECQVLLNKGKTP